MIRSRAACVENGDQTCNETRPNSACDNSDKTIKQKKNRSKRQTFQHQFKGYHHVCVLNDYASGFTCKLTDMKWRFFLFFFPTSICQKVVLLKLIYNLYFVLTFSLSFFFCKQMTIIFYFFIFIWFFLLQILMLHRAEKINKSATEQRSLNHVTLHSTK